MNYRLPTWDSTTAKTLRTGLQVIGGLFLGLITTIWSVPGVPEATWKYLQGNVLTILLSFGLPTVVGSMAITYIMNYFKKNVDNY